MEYELSLRQVCQDVPVQPCVTFNEAKSLMSVEKNVGEEDVTPSNIN